MIYNIHFYISFHLIFFLCTLQTDKKGCATFTFKLSVFTKVDKKALNDAINLKVNMEEEGTGKSIHILLFKKIIIMRT